MAGFQQEREALGAILRALRERAGLNGRELAQLLGWSTSKVSKVENGRQNITENDLRAWTAAVGASDSFDQLKARLDSLAARYVEWQRSLRAGTTPRQQAILGLETGTKVISAFETIVVPGLLQTEAYARSVLSSVAELYGVPNDAAAGARARMQRQQALYNPAKRFNFVMTETALRHRYATTDVLRGQLDRILASTMMSNVKVGIIPLSAPLPLAVPHGFWIFDQRLVHVETVSAELTLNDPAEVQLFSRIFQRLSAIARYGPAARAIVMDVLADLDGPAANS